MDLIKDFLYAQSYRALLMYECVLIKDARIFLYPIVKTYRFEGNESNAHP